MSMDLGGPGVAVCLATLRISFKNRSRFFLNFTPTNWWLVLIELQKVREGRMSAALTDLTKDSKYLLDLLQQSTGHLTLGGEEQGTKASHGYL